MGARLEGIKALQYFLWPTLFSTLVVALASAQTVTLSEAFTGNTTSSGWVLGGTGYTPVLTASSAGGNIDTVGNGWLRMTSSSTNQATYAVDTNSFAAAHATITTTFNYASYNGSGADGITFFLADASKPFSVGAYGGSLGYAQKTSAGTGGVSGGADINGMNGGYIGVGIDEFGNFSNPTEGRIGGTGLTPNAIAVRGPGQGLTGYDYLGGTNGLGTAIAFPGSTTRPTGTNLRTIQLQLTATNQLTVFMATGGTTNFVPLYTIDLSGYTRPDNLIMGFTSGTGGSTDIHEIQGLTLTSVISNLWTNGGADSMWETANNWNNTPAAVPGSYSDILLDNTFVNSAQNIAVLGNKLVRNLQIDAPFSYALSGGSIEFNNNGVAGPTGIFITQTHGAATQTIGSNLTFDNASQIQNNSTATLAITGSVALGSNAVTFSGSGPTSITGNLSGTGSLTQSGTGATTLSGANSYSGGTALSAGTLNANSSTALGTGAVTITGGTLGSTNGSTINNIVALQGNATFSGVNTSGAMTQSGNRTLTLLNANQSGTVNLTNSSTAQTLTVQVDSGSSNISGVIQNGGAGAGALAKTGAGTLVLGATNIYTGGTTVNAGTLQLGATNALPSGGALNIAGGTVNLNGYSDRVGNLTFSSNAVLDFGTAAVKNALVFTTLNPPPSGVLTINNYSGPDSSSFGTSGDFLGTTTASLSSTLLNQIYFSGFGPGSTESTGTFALGTYASGLPAAYQIAPTAINWSGYTWISDASQVWSTGANWQNGSGTNAYADFGGANSAHGTQFNPLLDANRTMTGIRFDSASTGTYTVGGAGTLTMSNASSLAFVQQQSSLAQTLSPVAITLSSNTVFDVTGAGSLTVGAPISGTGSLNKTGTGGKLVLTANNTYSGGTSIQNGTVQIQKPAALGAGAVAVLSGATLELNNTAGTTSNALNIAGSGISNNGAIDNVAGNATLSGAVTLASASRINADAGTLTLSGGIAGTNTNLNLGGAGNVTVNSAIATGTGTVTVDGSGTTTFSGAANTYTGATTVNSGALNLSKTGNVSIAGDLTINGGTVTATTSNQIATTSAVNVNGGTLALGAGANNTFSSIDSASGGTINLGSGATMTVNSTASNVFNGAITGSGALATAGSGTVTLGGSNTYSGGTTVGSIVTPLSNSAFGTGMVTVNSGGSIETQNTVSLANNFTLNSSGTTAYNGAIENISGNSTLTGAITLAGASRLQSDSGLLTATNTIALGGNLSVGGAGNTTLSGAMSGTGNLTKDGAGTLVLAANNSYSGGTSIQAGIVQVQQPAALGSGAAAVASGAGLEINNTGGTLTNALNITGTGVASKGAIDNVAGNNALSAAITLAGATRINSDAGTLTATNTVALGANALTVGGAGNTTLNGVISGTGGSLTKDGSGNLVLGGANTYTGNTTISSGTLQLGATNVLPGGVVNLSGGTLDLNGFSDKVGNLTFSNGGALDFGAAANANAFVFTTLNPAPSGVLTISNYNGPDASNFGTSGDFLGATTGAISASLVNQIYFSGYGTGSVESTGTYSLTGYGSGLGTAYQIAPSAPINWGNYAWKSNSSQSWNTNSSWNNNTRTNAYADFGYLNPTSGTQFNPLLDANRTMIGIRFDSAATASYNIGGTGTLTMSNGTGIAYIQQQSSFSNTLSPAAMSLSGKTVFDITGAGDLTIGAPIAGAGSLNKTGTGGKLILTANNTFSGGTSIQDGTVQIQKPAALGTGAVSVLSGATLELSNTAGTTSNALTIGGSGVSGNGAIDNLSGSATLSGAITLTSATQINADAGTLTLSGGISGANTNLDLRGGGNFAVSSAIATGTGTVTLGGTGTTTFSGAANTYTGATTVNGGALNLSKAAGTIAVAGNLVINGGTVTETASNQIATNSTVSLNGGALVLNSGVAQTFTGSVNTATGTTLSLLGSTTALTINSAASNSIAGNVTGSGSLTKSGSGTLTLSGNNAAFTGPVTVSGGTLLLASATALNSNNTLAIASNATAALNANETIASFNLSSSGTLDFGGNTLTLASGGSITAGTLAGSGTIIIGAGTSLTLNASVSNPNLNIILNGGSLFLNGTNDRLGSIQVTGNSVLDFGSTSASTLNATNVSVNPAATLTVNNWTNGVDYFYSQTFTGAVPDLRGAAPENQVGFSGFSNSSTVWQSYDHQITPAPEPATYGLLMIGAALGMLGLRRFRSNRGQRGPLAQ